MLDKIKLNLAVLGACIEKTGEIIVSLLPYSRFKTLRQT